MAEAILKPGQSESEARKRMTDFLLLCGILSAGLYIGADLAAGLRWEGYSFNSQTVSELFAIGAPTRPLVVGLFVAYALLVYAFAWGVWRSAGQSRALRVAAALMAAKELLGLPATFFAPIHLRGVPGTFGDVMHGVVTALGVFLCMFPAMGFAAAALGRGFRLYSIATMLLFIVFGVLAGLAGPRMAANLPTPWLGIWERINIYGYLIWVVVLALLLLRRGPRKLAGIA